MYVWNSKAQNKEKRMYSTDIGIIYRTDENSNYKKVSILCEYR